LCGTSRRVSASGSRDGERFFANFRVSEEQIQEIKQALSSEDKIERKFRVEVTDESGSVIAEVEKLVHFPKEGHRDIFRLTDFHRAR